ncbi:MAG: sulfatase-like hydrolase/transferase [Leptospiraceae bacterium]|nr:sulfatase-like hydrolase/transferase [Leptospiraceae bacterium]MCP5496058.1 sulfatase-like hydrolase/transferase [Leptospiraceae bacterium]
MLNKFKNLPFYIKYLLALMSVSMVLLFVYRITFYFMYSYRIKDSSYYTVFKAFLVGIRFDIMATTFLIGPFLLLASIHYLNRWVMYRLVWKSIPVFFVVLSTILSGVDLIYYENGNKHIGYEAYAYLGGDLVPLIRSAMEQSLTLFLLAIIGLVLFIFLISYFIKKIPYTHQNIPFVRAMITFFIVSAFVLLGARGGWQQSPLRTSDAIISNETIVNDLGLNPVFTTIMDMKVSHITKRHKMDILQAAKIVREEIKYPGAEFISLKYPLLRKTKKTKTDELPNIVVVILEGWTGRFIKPITKGIVDGKEVTPYFNAFLKEGLFFKNFFATGGRTTNGLMAIIGGIPDRPGLTAVRTQHIMNRFSGLGAILKTVGYKTLFVTGTDLSFNNKGKIMYHWGFDRLIGKKKIDELKKYEPQAWSFSDKVILEVLHEEMLKFPQNQPFVAAVHTGSTHYPYQTPEKKYEIFNQSTRDFEYLNSLHYADGMIYEFMEKVKKSPYFENTLFFFASDHSHHRYLNYYEDRNVPFLIYAPGLVEPGIRDDIASHLDILPTILGKIGREFYFSNMGRDLLQVKAGSAYFAYGNLFGWIEEDNFYFQSVEGGVGESFTVGPPFLDTKRCKINLMLCEKHYIKTKAFLNLSYHLLNDNKIFPDEAEILLLSQE